MGTNRRAVLVVATAIALGACSSDGASTTTTYNDGPSTGGSTSAPDMTSAPSSAPPSSLPAMVSAAVPDDLAFWRSLSMRADWIFSTPSFTEMLKYADVVVVARVASVSEAEPLEVEDLGTQLTNVDLHLEVVEGSFPSGVSDPVLRVEAPGSLGPDAAGSFEAWLQTFGSRLPTNYAVLVLRQRPDAPPNVYQILNEWSILVQDTDSVTTAFTEEDRVVPVASYEKVMGTVKSLDELYLLLLDARALEDAEA